MAPANRTPRAFRRLDISKLDRVVLIAIGLVACPPASWAIDLTPDTTRHLSDPSFLPLRGQVYSITTYAYTNVDADWRNASGITTQHYSASTNQYDQAFAFGITDRLSIGGSAGYFDTTAQNTFLSGSPTNGAAHQFTNPSFSATYRAIEQTGSPVSFDLKASFTPGIVDNQAQVGEIDLFVNRELKSPTIQGWVGAAYIDSHQASQGGVTSSVSSYWNYSVGIRSQLRLMERWAINSGVGYAKNTSTATNQSNGASYRDSLDGSWNPYIAATYDIVPDRVNLAVEYDHEFIGDDHRSGTFNGTWANQNQDFYGIHLRLLF